MIPKVIHYCWFGGNPIPEEYREYMKTWKKFCPDYEIKEWNERNYDISSKPLYVRQAYEAKKWAFVSDYARLDVIYNYGGIYLDTDVELIKNIDDLLQNEAFCGFESIGTIGLGLMFGAEEKNKLIKKLRDAYNNKSLYSEDKKIDMTPINIFNESILVPLGLKLDGTMQVVTGMKIYPYKYFGTADVWTGGARKVYPETYSIHHYGSSWWSDYNKTNLKRKRKVLKKYGKKRFDSGRGFVIADFWDDVEQVKNEKGRLRSILYAMKNIFKAYFGKMS